ncbi:MAG TPA: hypothetical protein VLJ14_10090, partial [Ktedonobacterales bacterium]|nr:hypothetical protein [Ktedonobacterales bacterium]
MRDRAAEGAGTERVADAPVFGRRNLLVAGALFLLSLWTLFSFQIAFHVNPFGIGTPHYVA